MKTHIVRKFHDSKDEFLQSLTKLTIRQIRGIYQRYGLKIKKVRSYTGAKVHLYDYHSLSCFQRAHFDTKHILDQKALPEQIYQQFLAKSGCQDTNGLCSLPSPGLGFWLTRGILIQSLV